MKQIILALVGVMIFLGCNSENNKLTSKLQRDLNPNATESELSKLIEDNNNFAYALYQNLDSSKNNTFFSPISISHALMMLYKGAAEETKQEMRMALNLTVDDARVDKIFNKLDLGLNVEVQEHIFKIANAIWPEKSFHFEQDYLDNIMVNYGASLKTLDYVNIPENSREKINSWVEDKTEDRIKDLIPEGAINSQTKMVISNATYFKDSWEHAFNPDNTKKGLFNKIETDFMNQTEVFPYYEDDNLQAIKLNYKSGISSMVIYLPKVDNLNQEAFNIEESFERYKVTLKMPKFEFISPSISLINTLETLGMKTAFDSKKANFSFLSKNGSLYVSDILHKAFIKIDEHGTEAAAATAILIKNTGIEEVPEANLTLDRPFIYQIVDNKTKQILFMGHMIKP